MRLIRSIAVEGSRAYAIVSSEELRTEVWSGIRIFALGALDYLPSFHPQQATLSSSSRIYNCDMGWPSETRDLPGCQQHLTYMI